MVIQVTKHKYDYRKKRNLVQYMTNRCAIYLILQPGVCIGYSEIFGQITVTSGDVLELSKKLISAILEQVF